MGAGKTIESVGGGNLSPRRLPKLSISSIQLTFVTFRAANIRPYGVARTIFNAPLKKDVLR